MNVPKGLMDRSQLAAAESLAAAKGLNYTIVNVSNLDPMTLSLFGVVTGQDPAPGRDVPAGYTVKLQV